MTNAQACAYHHHVAADFPRCSACRVTILPGMDTVFSADGRVHHLNCPQVICPVCSCEILPGAPIRRDGEAIVHGHCWMRRYRARVGVSMPADKYRADIVRARFASGAIPALEPTKVCGGTSTSGDSTCAGCAERILVGQIEYEVQFANTLVFRLHRACYVIWQDERGSVPREIRGGSGYSMLMFDDSVGQRAAWDRVAFTDFLLATSATRQTAVELRQTSQRIRATAEALCGVSRRACRASLPLGSEPSVPATSAPV